MHKRINIDFILAPEIRMDQPEEVISKTKSLHSSLP